MYRAAAVEAPQITIDDFARIELRVAQITLAERIPKADKLLRHGKPYLATCGDEIALVARLK